MQDMIETDNPPTKDLSKLYPPTGCMLVDGKAVPFQTTAEDAVRTLIQWMGQDPDEAGLKETPNRVVRALTEMTKGYREDPKAILSKTFEVDCDEIIVLKKIPFTSMCEHHLLPFSGEVDIGYLPGRVVGLSKLARLVDCYAQRLQMQERMTRQIAKALDEHLGAKGVAVVCRAAHSCMGCRGVKKPGAKMVTSVMLGFFRDNAPARQEFLELCRSGD